MDYRGHQIFIIHPDANVRDELVRSLRYSEYEAYGIAALDTDVFERHRESVIFLYISDDNGWKWQDFIGRIRLIDPPMTIAALGSSKLPDGFDSFIETSDSSALEDILKYLSDINARGHRHSVRFGSQHASIATFNFHHEGRLFAGVLHDLSLTGMSCTFKPEPEHLGHLRVDEILLNIPGYQAFLGGRFISKRVVAGQIIHVFHFNGNIPEETKHHIYNFIYSSLETKLSLH